MGLTLRGTARLIQRMVAEARRVSEVASDADLMRALMTVG